MKIFSKKTNRRFPLPLVKQMAEKGEATGQFLLGFAYAEGRGIVKDSAEAVKWFRLAADQGFTEAQHWLGKCYLTGTGVPKDSSEAIQWWKKAAEKGHAGAQFSLGLVHAEGCGVPKDKKEAMKYFRQIAYNEKAPRIRMMLRYAWFALKNTIRNILHV